MLFDQPIQFPIRQWQEGEGRCQITLIILDTGFGVQGLLIGGEKPHVGGQVLAVPRKSLRGEGWSCDTYITPVPGHKDTEVARTVAELLACELQLPVAVTAGIHSDHLSAEELKEILTLCNSLSQKAVDFLKSAHL